MTYVSVGHNDDQRECSHGREAMVKIHVNPTKGDLIESHQEKHPKSKL